MRALIILEFHFIKDKDGKIYTEVTGDSKFWDRYLNIFENITVCARVSEANKSFDSSKYLLASRENVDFVSLNDFRGAGGVVSNFYNTFKVVKEAIKKCDCAIIRTPSPISMLSYPVIKSSNKPFAIELMMNPQTAYSRESLKHPLQPFIQYFMTMQTKIMCLKANGVSYVTEHVLQKKYPCRALLLTGNKRGYFTSSYSTISLKKEDFDVKQWSNDKSEEIVTLIHSGKMEDYRKGQNTFIKLISMLRSNGFDVKGVLLGDGSKKNEFEQLARDLKVDDQIEFLGWMSGFESVKAQLRKADIFVFPTVGEGLPRGVIEAMANGLVCVSSPVDGVVELIDSELLSKHDDINGFYSIVKSLLTNKTQLKNISLQNTEKARKYEDSILTEKRSEFYRMLRKSVENMS